MMSNVKAKYNSELY